MKWVLGIAAVMLIMYLWTRWEVRKSRRAREPEHPPKSGDHAPPR